jgi:hypothetical protein
MDETGNKTEPDKQQLFWGPKHNIIYANAFQFRVSDHDISIELGTLQNISNAEAILSAHQLIMTFRSAKVLSIILSQAVDALEGRFGEIKLDAEKMATLQAALTEAAKKISDK